MALIAFNFHVQVNVHTTTNSVNAPGGIVSSAPVSLIQERKPKGVFERPKGSGIWWIRFWKNGVEKRRKVGPLDQAIAAYRAAVEGEIWETNAVFSILAEEHLAARSDLVSQSHASHTRYFKKVFAGLSVVEVASRIEEWRTKRLREVSKTTVRHQMAFLRMLFERAIKLGLVRTNPIGGRDGVKAPRPNPPKSRVLSPEEELELLALCNEDDRDHLRFLLLTGIRRGELVGLRWEHVRAETLTVEKGGRTGKTRSLWLRPEAQEILQRRKASGLALPFPRALAWCAGRFYNLTKRAGIPEVTAHTLRHTFATRLLEATGDLMAVHHALGHASLDMTKRYLSLSASHLRGAIERADNL